MPQVLFRAIRSRAKLEHFDIITEEVSRDQDNIIKPDLIRLHEDYVKDWKSVKVGFGSRKVITDTYIAVYVWPTGEGKDIYQVVSKGAPAHKIRARNFPTLKFDWAGPGTYHAKTFPYARPARLFTSGVMKTRFPKEVDHPGFEPRRIEKQIGDKYYPTFRRVTENAFRRGIRKAKNAIASSVV